MKQFVIIGNSAAGVSCVEAIRERDKESKIIVISDEDYNSYCRCLISYFLAGDVKEEKIILRPESFYKDNNVELKLNKKVIRVDPKKSRVVLEDKTQIAYDALLIASGAHPKMPDTPGIKKRGVFGLRTIKDALDISGLLITAKNTCVLGGGLVGLKAAYALHKRKSEVKVIVRSKQILSQIIDSEAAAIIQKRLEANGIEVILGEGVTEIIGNGDIRAVKLGSGKAIGTSLVVVGKGVAPNIELIKNSEIKFNTGIIASELLQSNIPNIYAAGDVCESFDLALDKYAVNAIWPAAVGQGKIAGANMAGESIRYPGSMGMNSLEFFGLPVVSLGVYKLKEDQRADYEVLKFSDPKNNTYRKVIIKKNVVVGAILIGGIVNSGVITRLIREKINVAPLRHRLLEENFGYPDIIDYVTEKENLYV
ncbi:NAD(P)/FAD-dependent oxidoreductase [Candidatus Omnitrophota bacterium]